MVRGQKPVALRAAVRNGSVVLAGFIVSFTLMSYYSSPVSRSSVTGFVRAITGPRLDHSPPDSVPGPGSTLALPDLIPSTLVFPGEEMPSRFVLTLFDITCPAAWDSVPFWNRVARELRRENIQYVLAACAEREEDLATAEQFAGLEVPPRYVGACDAVDESLELGGHRIVHFGIGSESTVLDVWVGRPLYSYVEGDLIAQMIHAVQPKAPPRDDSF